MGRRPGPRRGVSPKPCVPPYFPEKRVPGIACFAYMEMGPLRIASDRKERAADLRRKPGNRADKKGGSRELFERRTQVLLWSV